MVSVCVRDVGNQNAMVREKIREQRSANTNALQGQINSFSSTAMHNHTESYHDDTFILALVSTQALQCGR
jgi:hypothetical protein